MDRSNILRIAILVYVIGSLVFLAGEAHSYQLSNGTEHLAAEMNKPLESRETVIQPPNGTVAITTQSGRASFIGGDDGEIVVFDEKGRVLYFNGTANDYWDVDPIPGEDNRIVYVATYPNPNGSGILNAIEIVDLRTGDVQRIYTNVTEESRWHDVDRISSNEYAIADIDRDMVHIINVSNGETIWSWDAQSTYPPSAGGDFEGDWTHINDVEEFPNGDILVSVRNMDQVIRINRETGLVANWTLGSDGAHDILREQHNPDYIPPERGGPSLLVADSENNRIIE